MSARLLIALADGMSANVKENTFWGRNLLAADEQTIWI